MKFICLGFYDEAKWNELSEQERASFMDECFAYDDELRAGGHFTGGEALQSVTTALTIRYRNGQSYVTDGPYAETKEQLGGYYLIDATDLDEAINIASRIPGARKGTVEIRPILELTGLPARQEKNN